MMILLIYLDRSENTLLNVYKYCRDEINVKVGDEITVYKFVN